jgi:hypothetical protein
MPQVLRVGSSPGRLAVLWLLYEGERVTRCVWSHVYCLRLGGYFLVWNQCRRTLKKNRIERQAILCHVLQVILLCSICSGLCSMYVSPGLNY